MRVFPSLLSLVVLAGCSVFFRDEPAPVVPPPDASNPAPGKEAGEPLSVDPRSGVFFLTSPHPGNNYRSAAQANEGCETEALGLPKLWAGAPKERRFVALRFVVNYDPRLEGAEGKRELIVRGNSFGWRDPAGRQLTESGNPWTEVKSSSVNGSLFKDGILAVDVEGRKIVPGGPDGIVPVWLGRNSGSVPDTDTCHNWDALEKVSALSFDALSLKISTYPCGSQARLLCVSVDPVAKDGG